MPFVAAGVLCPQAAKLATSPAEIHSDRRRAVFVIFVEPLIDAS
jgi:hypothetical protein